MSQVHMLHGKPYAVEFRTGSTVRTGIRNEIVDSDFIYQGAQILPTHTLKVVMPIDVLIAFIDSLPRNNPSIARLLRPLMTGKCAYCLRNVTWHDETDEPRDIDGKICCQDCWKMDDVRVVKYLKNVAEWGKYSG